MALEIIFENEHLLALDKPNGWLSVPSRLGKDEQRLNLIDYLRQQYSQNFWPVHRLDYEVTGIILVAKSARAHKAANNWFTHHKVRKQYQALAVVAANQTLPPTGKGATWSARIVKGKKRAFEAAHGKEATTVATCIDPDIGTIVPSLPRLLSLWELNPLTGRSHQLRFEMARHGLPILGDKLYGDHTPLTCCELPLIALRAVELKLEIDAAAEAKALGVPAVFSTHGLVEFLQRNAISSLK